MSIDTTRGALAEEAVAVDDEVRTAVIQPPFRGQASVYPATISRVRI
jgi:hypothetical protein